MNIHINALLKLSLATLCLMITPVISFAQETDPVQKADSLKQNEVVKASDSSEMATWQKANEAYSNGQYQVAELLYSQLIEEGFHDAALYYNLGNSCFQQNQIGRAILNFKRAYLINPTDKDIEYNLELAKSRTKDKIDQVPTFFLSDWIKAIRQIFSPDGWAKTIIVLLILDLLMVLVWFLSGALNIRKAGFYSSVLLTFLLIISIINAFSSAHNTYKSNEAIVINSAALIKSSPAESGKDLFVVHEGTAVEIIQTLDKWNEVELADGNKGWILSSAIEKVIRDTKSF